MSTCWMSRTAIATAAVLTFLIAGVAIAATDYTKTSTDDLRLLAQRSDVDAQSELVRRYLRGGVPAKDKEDLAEWIRRSADAGSPQAQVELGNLHLNGIGVEKNHAEALRVFRLAADQDYARGYGGLGLLYHFGWGVAQNFAEAAMWYRRAADKDDGRAQWRLGALYEDGKGVTQDVDIALVLYQRAAKQGVAEAYYAIGQLYEFGKDGRFAKNEKEAAVWYQGAVDRDHFSAALQLGNLYVNGTGVAKNDSKALELYRRAADLGNVGAYVNLAYMYNGGYGVEKDLEEAFRLNLKAAELGNAIGQFNIGLYYERGTGTPRDLLKAHEWYDKSAQQGDAEAIVARDRLLASWQFRIGSIHYEPNPTRRDADTLIVVDYSEPTSETSIPVTERWQLFSNDEPVGEAFERRFDIEKGKTRHQFVLPLPAGASEGIFKLRLTAASPAADEDTQLLLEIR